MVVANWHVLYLKWSGAAACAGGQFGAVLLAAALVGTGSSVFHPESSRVARMASGGRHGLAQSIFQVGGNFGSSSRTLAGGSDYRALWQRQRCLVCACGTAGDRGVGANQPLVLGTAPNDKGKPKATIINPLPRNNDYGGQHSVNPHFSKYFYMASISSYYTFYLMQKFGLSIQNAQLHLFAFLFAVAAGTVIGGPVGDKIGRNM